VATWEISFAQSTDAEQSSLEQSQETTGSAPEVMQIATCRGFLRSTGIAADAEAALDFPALARLVQRGNGKAGIAHQADGHGRKLPLQPAQQAPQ
jgi:hypothetical protein